VIHVKWHGHSCFEIWSDEEEYPRILIDPHDGGSIGLPKPEIPISPDIILITHDHFDHNYYDPYTGNKTSVIKWKKGSFSIRGVRIEGIPVPHDEANGKLRGFVTAYKIMYGDLTLIHLGDVGSEKLPDDILEKLSGANIVFIPVGGVYTIGAVAANRLLSRLQPNIAVPMHYWVEGMTLPLDPLDRFLELTRFRRYRLDSNEFEINRDSLPKPVSLFILKL
jgi:L-ascorbate metabolism protein UlaG (beta-lactamase superfamily)